MTNDRFFIAFLMLIAALWLRQRARKLAAGQRRRALYGLLLFLIPALLVGRWAFDRLPFGRYENLAIEIAGLAAMFSVMAFVFVKPAKEGEKATKNT
jgi:thiol:disulfide interchange protein